MAAATSIQPAVPTGFAQAGPVTQHQCMIYRGSPSDHLPGLAAVAQQRLAGNWRCLYLNNPQAVSQMRAQLDRDGVAVDQEIERGALLLCADQNHLGDGCFDVERMLRMLEDAVSQAVGDGFTGLWASGDMGWEFGDEKNFAKLLEYEYALERLFQRQPRLSGICQYNAEALPTDVVQWGLCTHKSVYINEALSTENPHYSPARLLTYRRPIVPVLQLEGVLARSAR